MTDAQALRRERAFAAGLCTTCCRAAHRSGRRTCNGCIEASRKSKAKRTGRIYVPQLRTTIDNFDIAADRREEWLAINEIALRHYVGSIPC